MTVSAAWKEDTLHGLARGSRVWCLGPDGRWKLGTLQSVGSKECTVAFDSDLGEGTGAVVAVKPASVVPANPALLDSVQDLTNLSFLNQPSILHALRQRYSSDGIYTHAGPVLIAINPFKAVPFYSPEYAQHYKGRSNLEVTEGYEPHVFLTADKAYKQMCKFGQCQSVLITGESGAGKTETTKIVMRYLAGLAGGTGMEDKVLDTNPLLEAFGNAKTIHNNNSSRFGKLIEIYFSHSHQICGALIHTYLLEKSRVVHQLPNERSYHIFYQLCRGASPDERQAYLLPEASKSFDYLNRSGCTTIPGVDDAAEFAEVKHAMSAVGIAAEQQHSIFSILAAILWLGNITFLPLSEDAVAVAQSSAEAISRAAALLCCPEEALVRALTKRKLVVGGESITRDMNMDAALDNRDALAKALYAGLFSWLVEQVNSALAVGKQRSETSLSILDIYGFECFKENSFEQLCINYANERLQQQFNKHLFKLEQQEYESEGIDWAHVEFEDNQECVDLIEARPPQDVGILSLLDEECIYPRGTDSSFAVKLRQRQGSHPRFSHNPKVPTDDFTLHHYAGPVVYRCNKFLDKNKDTLSPDLVLLLQGSQQPLVQALAVEMSRGQDKKGTQTVGARFREQLRDLIQRLDATSLHFIRCIKPNSQQVAAHFDPQLVLHQLKCCGVLEVTRIARAGYPTRYRHDQFASRYKVLLPELGSGPLPNGMTALDVCTKLLRHFNVDPRMYQVGRTRLFFRAGVLGQLEDTWARIQRSVLYIQSMWRMARQRRAFLQLRQAVVVMQSHWRGRQARLLFADMVQQHQAAVAVQAAFRGFMQRQRFLRAVQAAKAIQMAWRRWQVNQRIAVRTTERMQWEAEQSAITEARRQEEESFEAIKQEFGMDGGEIREVLALWQRHGMHFMGWMEQREDADLAAAAAAADGSTAADLEQKIGTLEAYSRKLERQVADLREENGLLQHAVETLQQVTQEQQLGSPVQGYCAQVLANSISPVKRDHPGSPQNKPPRHPSYNVTAVADGTAGASQADEGAQQQRRRSGRRSEEDTISLMSLSEDSFSTELGGTSMERTPLSSVQEMSTTQDEGHAAILSLDREFDKKRALFDDDADFIREVREGMSDAPGMNPDMELKRLVQRYKAWKKSFKSRLTATQQAVKHRNTPLAGSSRQHFGGSSTGGTPKGAPGHSRRESGGGDGSLTARLFGTIKGNRANSSLAR